ncbi:uncharacterized protein K444DRAFT_289979 [Hyaloscypha bicolor E]|uniref:Uncharacterized protein n=1 Tax=Hyaloscypha bicolor E TaxID=1095630 RepID=A0A2J6SFL4_9HELO|nr:uncharacterized protein K444DRAFT_289979 [Hyaloscypha bicolor E]PMD49534.1 hypothetical protein K444DRAFT_289979 [Hyaloscypha bicolor E]
MPRPRSDSLLPTRPMHLQHLFARIGHNLLRQVRIRYPLSQSAFLLRHPLSPSTPPSLPSTPPSLPSTPPSLPSTPPSLPSPRETKKTALTPSNPRYPYPKPQYTSPSHSSKPSSHLLCKTGASGVSTVIFSTIATV